MGKAISVIPAGLKCETRTNRKTSSANGFKSSLCLIDSLFDSPATITKDSNAGPPIPWIFGGKIVVYCRMLASEVLRTTTSWNSNRTEQKIIPTWNANHAPSAIWADILSQLDYNGHLFSVL